MKAGSPLEARNHFQRLLSDRGTPAGIAERARVMVALLDEADRAAGAPGAEEKPAAPSTPASESAKDKAAPGKSK
jgi:hypothetical protein